MNTVKSFWIGWGALIIAGGGAYYYAKRDINASRREKYLRYQQQQQQNAALEATYSYPDPPSSALQQQQHQQRTRDIDNTNSPSQEASFDPAPTRHEPDTDAQRLKEKSKYEASEVYKRPSGDRFT